MPRSPTSNDDRTPTAESLAAATVAGMAAIDETIEELAATGDPATCRDIGRLFDTAIEHGAPVWNKGSQVGCAAIYLHTAKAIVVWLRPEGRPAAVPVSPPVEGLLDALATVVRNFPEAVSANASELGWTMRGIFDRFHASRGMEDVDELIEVVAARRGPVNADLVSACLTVAMGHGQSLFQAGHLDACAILHAHTGRRVLALAQQPTLPDPALRRVRGELTPLVARYSRITEATADRAAWDFYRAFQRILDVAPHEDIAPASDDTYDGFISYRRTGGSAEAMAIRSSLLVRKLNAFVDVVSLDSGAFGPHLLDMIASSPAFLVLLTPGCLDRCSHPSDWMRREISHAIQANRHIIPILFDGFRFEDAPALPEDIQALSDYQAVRYSHDYFDAVIDKLEKYIRAAGK